MNDCTSSAVESRMLCTGCAEQYKREHVEQRYERLAQVAREMLVEYKRLFTSHVVAAGRIKTFTKFTSAGDFLDKLDALVVSVDE